MQFEGKSLFIRADANTHMGTGHLMRCLALAQGWKARGGRAMFITACESDSLRHRLSDEGFQVIMLERSYPEPADWETTSQALAAHPGAWVVLDGYHFDPAYQCQIKEAGHRLLVIDDMAHLNHYYADVVLNQNINAERLRYSCEPYTRLLLGTRYVLLRAEFLAWQGWRREIPKVAHKVLVTLGGGDPNNVTLKVIQALQQLDVPGLKVRVIVGPANPHLQTLQQAVDFSRCSMQLLTAVTNVPELMAWADIAISAGGSTCWEIAFMGLPSYTIVLAENQVGVAEMLHKQGVSVNMGWFSSIDQTKMAQVVSDLIQDKQRRSYMSDQGRSIVPGLGTRYVVSTILD
jgi:UDP-2,4-diacetamido-2,4,6-trideoxy-beta-L-altropyranose hydrolase